MEFTDRVFLANYSIDAISAATPAGITSFLFLAFFGGVGSYAGVFIAQHTGRGEHKKIGGVLWQGIYFSLFSGIFLILLGLYGSETIFLLGKHPPEVQKLEVIYFRILSYTGFLHVAMVTLATFFSGRGITRPVMVITFIGVFINIPLDYAMIFGKWGFPQLGIEGAAYATATAWGANVLLLCILIFTNKNDRTFHIFSNIALDPKLFKRLLHFGIPGSLQFTIDILGFTFFIFLVGRIGKAELAATNIVFAINALAFMPSMGASQGISILVGQALGNGKPLLAEQFVKSTFQLLAVYILFMDLLFIFCPDLVLKPFLPPAPISAENAKVAILAGKLLNMIAAYLFFDAGYMLFSGALRGAGDTRFMMMAVGIAAPICLIIPVYVGIVFLGCTIQTAWIWVITFIFALFSVSALRYRFGAWKKMLVIKEETPN